MNLYESESDIISAICIFKSRIMSTFILMMQRLQLNKSRLTITCDAVGLVYASQKLCKLSLTSIFYKTNL